MAQLLDVNDLPHTEPPAPAITFTAMVADDDEGLRGLLASYLEGEGVAVSCARSGEEAIAELLKLAPDMVFLDVEMPGCTGLEVLELIRERGLHTAVIMISAHSTEEVIIEALRRGTNDFLRKPFDRADVQAVLDRTVARILLSRQNMELRARVHEQQLRIELELAKAARVVSELMPRTPPPVPGFAIAASCISAREVGGDFYDWLYLPSGALSLTVGDVMGKGLSAALLMASTRAVIRTVAVDASPAAAIQRAAAALDADLARAGAFVTMFHAQIDIASGVIRYVDAGHGYVLLRRANGTIEDLKPWGLPLGVDSQERYQEGSVVLGPGDTLLVYSDGLTEARPDLFTDRHLVATYAARNDAEEIVEGLMAEVAAIKPLPDDLTLVVVRRQPIAAAV